LEKLVCVQAFEPRQLAHIRFDAGDHHVDRRNVALQLLLQYEIGRDIGLADDPGQRFAERRGEVAVANTQDAVGRLLGGRRDPLHQVVRHFAASPLGLHGGST
jgi:hypothetical protein